MGMATFTDNTRLITQEFKGLKAFYDRLQKEYSQLNTLSMGMSGDYPLAITEGSNMIRVGSKIFGARNYWLCTPLLISKPQEGNTMRKA